MNVARSSLGFATLTILSGRWLLGSAASRRFFLATLSFSFSFASLASTFWIKRGEPVTREKKPNFPKLAAVVIVKILLSVVDPNKKAADCKNRGPRVN